MPQKRWSIEKLFIIESYNRCCIITDFLLYRSKYRGVDGVSNGPTLEVDMSLGRLLARIGRIPVVRRNRYPSYDMFDGSRTNHVPNDVNVITDTTSARGKILL